MPVLTIYICFGYQHITQTNNINTISSVIQGDRSYHIPVKLPKSTVKHTASGTLWLRVLLGRVIDHDGMDNDAMRWCVMN